jgi:hypothetical protein
MRLDIYISTDVCSPRKKHGTYHARWIGYNNTGQMVGEDGTTVSEYDNEYGMLVRALREAAGHINQYARPEIRICCTNRVIVQSIKQIPRWTKRGFKKRNGQDLSHAEDWKYIAGKLSGLYFKVDGGASNGS